ncbi:MAG: type II toxin-antitoxin system prevent-host-death family antitoxin [Nitrococcus sp.]|nr:type II toxin-antitoxin system prevent-host-death family antitoxin [Nitrococcus sp.]
MTGDTKKIQSYQARMHWSRILDEVRDGTCYLVSKRGAPTAALVPVEQVVSGGDADRELALLLEQFEARHAETVARLDEAFAELAATREALGEWRAERDGRGPDYHGGA